MQGPFRFLLSGALFPAAQAALAHDGHGLAGGHWHATDSWGLVVAAAGAALAIWLGSRE